MDQGRTLIIVLCMHRSGSSFLTNLLERLGMSLGPFERLPPNEFNKHGHFEPLPLVTLNSEVQERIFGFVGDTPLSAELFHRFRQSAGRWPAEQTIPEELLQRGRDLIDRLLASAPISGFKDPRTVLCWPFWRRVLADVPGLRVVPLLLTRSPNEIAASLFARGGGEVAYGDLLDLVEIHYQRMQAICEEFGGDVPIVRFDPRTFVEQARQAAQRCGLAWDEAVVRQVYDPACRHHAAMAVSHPAQQAFERLRGPGDDLEDAATLAGMLAAAAAREDILNARVAHYRQELAATAAAAREQFEKLHAEIHAAKCELVQLKEEIALIRGSRTWRLRQMVTTAIARVRPSGGR